MGEGIIGNYHPLDKYFAYGIRNSFGMAFDPLSGNLWDVENGPEFGDEINLVNQASIVDGTKYKAFGRQMRILQAILRLILEACINSIILVSISHLRYLGFNHLLGLLR